MTKKEIKNLRESFDFTQRQMADILGIHPNAYQRMEYGSSPIPKYIGHYALSLTALNENKLFRKHIDIIGVELEKEKICTYPGCSITSTRPCVGCGRDRH